MKNGTSKIWRRLLFWAVLIAAPVAFFVMLSFYLNSYLTSDRVIAGLQPALELLSGRRVSIGNADLSIGYRSVLTVEDVRFYRESSAGEDTLDAVLRFGTMQFRPHTMFVGPSRIDSVIIDGFEGRIEADVNRSLSDLVWESPDGSQTIRVQLSRSDLLGLNIKSLKLRNASFTVDHGERGPSIHFESYEHDLTIDGVRVMNFLLITGTVNGAIKDPVSDRLCRVSLTGRLQYNFDDGSVYLRNAALSFNDAVFPLSAFVFQDGTDRLLRIVFQTSEPAVADAYCVLPEPIRDWLEGVYADKDPFHVELVFNNGGDPDTAEEIAGAELSLR
jgi:hypothetical protein